MALIELLRDSPTTLYWVCSLLGLCIGSFLNVVILRLPRILEAEWRREAREQMELEPEDVTRLTLWSPPSRCEYCGTPIRPWHNIPVFGWLWLRGKAACCGGHISIQYPIVELTAGILAWICVWRFGWSWQLLAALTFSWTLLTLTVIDLRTQLLPDIMTLPLLWLGLLISLPGLFVTAPAAIVGAAAGYLLLWGVFHLFRLITGKEGMGRGDFKLLAALGAWLGASQIPVVIFLASIVGTAVGVGLIVFRRHGRDIPIAFGPYLAGAGWLALIFSPQIHSMTMAWLSP